MKAILAVLLHSMSALRSKRTITIPVTPQSATLQEKCGKNYVYAFSERFFLLNISPTPDNFMDLIALPVLAAKVCDAGLLALRRNWLDSPLPARLDDVDRMAALADILHGTNANQMLEKATGLFAVTSQHSANLTWGDLAAVLNGPYDLPKITTCHRL